MISLCTILLLLIVVGTYFTFRLNHRGDLYQSTFAQTYAPGQVTPKREEFDKESLFALDGGTDVMSEGITTDEKSTSSQQQVVPADAPEDAEPSGSFVFTVYGYGHGVGMSQTGAIEYAKRGYSYREILTHYYAGVSLDFEAPPEELSVHNVRDGKTVTAPPEELIAGVIEGEIGSGCPLEAQKAQAVAAYTYILYQNRKGNLAELAYKTPSSTALSASDEVLGEYVSYNENPILAVFFSTSSGKTTTSSNVWGGSEMPYLQAVESLEPNSSKDFHSSKTYTARELAERVKKQTGITLSGNPSGWFTILEHDAAVDAETGYVRSISIAGQKKVSGDYFRSKILGYGIKSHCFHIEYFPDA